MKIIKSKVLLLLAVCLVVMQSYTVSMAAETSGGEIQVGESPYKMKWKAGDPTSENPNEYQIYPTPQSVVYPGGDSFTLSGEVKVAVSETIDQSTQNYIKEVLEEKNLTVSFVAGTDDTADIRMGVQNDGGWAANNLSPSTEGLFDKDDAYMLTVADNKINILGKDTTAAFYGVATLKMMLSSLENAALVPVTIEDFADIPVRGVVEGFYGGFWDEHRKSEMLFSRDVKMNIFIYASKTDPLHDRQWATPYPEDRMAYFQELVDIQEQTKCEFSWAVHTGAFFGTLTDANRETQMNQLKNKFQQFIDIGVRRFAMLNDDYGAGAVATVVSVVNEMNEWLKSKDCEPLAYCPQGYNVSWAGNGTEIRGLADLQDDVLIFWTGADVNSPFYKSSIEYVINNTKKADDPTSFQRPMFWVNYPCNEHTGGQGLLLGSAKYYLQGDIGGLLGGAVANPVEFAETNKVALFQLANYFWNIEKAAANADEVWEQCFKYLQPEVYDAYYTIARNACEAPGSRRIPGMIDESAYMQADLEAVQAAVANDTLTADNKDALDLLAEFVHIQDAMVDFVENCTNKTLIDELSNPSHLQKIESGEGWVQALDNLGRAGELLVRAQLQMAGEAPDSDLIWKYFSEAVTEMERYNTRTHAYHEAADVQTRAGTKRILPFVNALMADVEAYINAESSMTELETPADRIYTNISSLARTPLTIQEDEFSVRGLNGITLEAGNYVGIKKAGIAEITGFVLEGRGTDGLTLEYSLYGDTWTEAEPGDLQTPVMARYVRLRNAGNSSVSISLKKLAIKVSNEEPKVRVLSNAPLGTAAGEGTWEAVADGSRTTFARISRNQAANDYVTVDLGEVRPIHDVAFYTEDGSRYIYHADVAISTDDQSYTTIGTIDDTTNSSNIDPPFRKYEFDGSGQDGRYIRLKITEAEEAQIKLYEIEINQTAPEFDSGRTPSQLVIGSVSNGLNRINDGDTSTLYSVANMAAGGYLEYRITENMPVEQFTIFQGVASNAKVSIIDSEGNATELGTASELFGVFTVPSGKRVHKIRLDFETATEVAISEIGLKCGADTSGDVGVAVENVYLDEAPADSAERVNLALNQPVEAPSHDGNRIENAVDGNADTRWAGNNGGSSYFTVDLGLYTNIIEEIKISYYRKVYPTAYSIQVSNDGTNWVTIDTGTHDNTLMSPTDTVALETPIVARFVKLVFTSFNPTAAVQNSVGITELVVNGYRRTASMEYSSAQTPAQIETEVGGTVTLPALVDVAIADMDSQSYDVQVIPTWNPSTINTSAAGIFEASAVLPVTVNLDNGADIQCVQSVRVGSPADAVDVNLALNQPVEVSGVEMTSSSSSTAHVGSRAVDGDSNSRWSSGPLNDRAMAGTVEDQWIVVDLGPSPVLIKEIKAAYYNKVWPMQYRMELSNDRNTWITVESYDRPAEDRTGVIDTVTFDTPVSARYLRLYFPEGQLNTAAAGGTVSITELTVTGDRLVEEVTYESLTDTFEAIEADSTVAAQDLELPGLLNATWKKSGAAEATAVQILAAWDLSAYDQAREGEVTLTSEPFTGTYHKNTNNLTASITIIKKLVQPDLAALMAKIEEARAIAADGYTPESYQNLQDKLAEAEQLINGTPTQEQADIALRELSEAISNLTPDGKEPEDPQKPDLSKYKTELGGLIKQADEAAASGKYTDASMKAVDTHNKTAKTVLNAPSSTEAQFKDIIAKLKDALAKLEEKKADNPPAEPPKDKPWIFTDVDVNPGAWKYESVKYVYNNDIMGAITGTTEFQPDRPLSRSMFATVLYRMADSPAVTYADTFSDVPAGKWYSDAIIWANQKGIVQGLSDGSFGIDNNITREQIAKMLFEYADKVCGFNVSDKKDLAQFTDADAVSNWAVGYMQWATAVEMITGKPNDAAQTSFRMDPKGEATRAECAAMLMRFENKYVNK